MEVLLFAGTVEGRRLAEWLDARGTCSVVACTATEYGASLLADGTHVVAVQGPLSMGQKRELMEGHRFSCIVDATHPYALHISASVAELGRSYGVDVIRVEREVGKTAAGAWTSAANMAEAARHVAKTSGNVLLTTGSKDLATFVQAMPDYRDRLYVRILPVQASLAHVLDMGVPVSHVIAMQGPFSARLNAALLQELDISCMVTKRSGRVGGFDEKVRAACECGVELVVVERPPKGEGVSLEGAMRLLEERYGL